MGQLTFDFFYPGVSLEVELLCSFFLNAFKIFFCCKYFFGISILFLPSLLERQRKCDIIYRTAEEPGEEVIFNSSTCRVNSQAFLSNLDFSLQIIS